MVFMGQYFIQHTRWIVHCYVPVSKYIASEILKTSDFYPPKISTICVQISFSWNTIHVSFNNFLVFYSLFEGPFFCLKVLSKQIVVALNAAALCRWWEPSNRRMTRRWLNCCLSEPCWGSIWMWRFWKILEDSGAWTWVAYASHIIYYYYENIYYNSDTLWLWSSMIHIIQCGILMDIDRLFRKWLAYEDNALSCLVPIPASTERYVATCMTAPLEARPCCEKPRSVFGVQWYNVRPPFDSVQWCKKLQ